MIKSTLPNDFECIFLELNFKNSKWLLFGAYKPPSQCSNFFFSEVTKAITKLNSKYDNLLLLGDFNESVKDTILRNFMDDNTLKCLIKEPTCYKNPNNPSCIDLILTNQSRKFKNSCVFDNGLSDFHRLVLTSFRFKFSPGAPKQVFYRSYKIYNPTNFQKELVESIKNDTDHDTFNQHLLNVLDKHAPIKQKTLRANEAPYMTKALKRAMMKRTELANKYHKHRRPEDFARFRKHRNYVDRLYKRERREYFNRLKKNDIEDNKCF